MAVAAVTPLLTGLGVSATTAATVGTVASYASAAFTLFSGIQSYSQAKSAASAERGASQSRARELQLEMQQERTQNAIEDAERARQLRRNLASQRAAGAGIVDETGNILNIQNQTMSESQRNENLAGSVSDNTVANLNRQAMSTLRAGENAYAAGMSKASTSLINTVTTVGGQIGDIASVTQSGGTSYDRAGGIKKRGDFTMTSSGEQINWNR
jgi:hypothetical protein